MLFEIIIENIEGEHLVSLMMEKIRILLIENTTKTPMNDQFTDSSTDGGFGV